MNVMIKTFEFRDQKGGMNLSTRAVYTFSDSNDMFHVYKHHDGYPSGAYDSIVRALSYAWDLPRFEASEFGAAFITANKDKGGGIYLTSHWKAHGDLEYRYEISFYQGTLYIIAFEVSLTNQESTLIFTGTLKEFSKFIEEND